jgi:hypothetical protein
MEERGQRLARELRAELPPAIAGLDAADAERLAELLAGARERQHTALIGAVDDGLGFVPRLLRGPVKRALGL